MGTNVKLCPIKSDKEIGLSKGAPAVTTRARQASSSRGLRDALATLHSAGATSGTFCYYAAFVPQREDTAVAEDQDDRSTREDRFGRQDPEKSSGWSSLVVIVGVVIVIGLVYFFVR